MWHVLQPPVPLTIVHLIPQVYAGANIMANDIAKNETMTSQCATKVVIDMFIACGHEPIDMLQHLSGYLSCIALAFVKYLGGAGLSTLELLRCLEPLAVLKSRLGSGYVWRSAPHP